MRLFWLTALLFVVLSVTACWRPSARIEGMENQQAKETNFLALAQIIEEKNAGMLAEIKTLKESVSNNTTAIAKINSLIKKLEAVAK